MLSQESRLERYNRALGFNNPSVNYVAQNSYGFVNYVAQNSGNGYSSSGGYGNQNQMQRSFPGNRGYGNFFS